LDQIIFRALVFLGLAVDIESGAGENVSDIGSIIAFFLFFSGGIIVITE
jgi:hypothetical protein